MTTAIIRHRRENLKKCSLSGLEEKNYLRFYSYPNDPLLPDFTGFLLLKVGAPPLTEDDADRGLLLIDGTWRLALVIEKQIPFLESRSLPSHYRTAYPRKQTDCPDPSAGLSSVEALYLAHKILKRPHADLLDFYYWKSRFLELNELS